MPDKLTQIFDTWNKIREVGTPTSFPTPFQAFQAGFTAAAQSMRQRALTVCDKATTPKNTDTINQIKNGIGQLSDIPQ